MTAMIVSVIFGTYNRRQLLERCVRAVRTSVGSLPYEIVVTDGGSTDGSREWLAVQPDVVLVGRPSLEGAVRAFNEAFLLARGRYIVTLNDDLYPVGAAITDAVAFMDSQPSCGQGAFEYWDGDRWGWQVVHRGLVYANFGIIRRDLAHAIAYICGGLWTPCYHTYGGDTELSCWVWRLGWEVLRMPGIRIYDTPCDDALRARNHAENKRRNDGKTFWSRWTDAEMLHPDGPPPRVDDDTIRRLREMAMVVRPGSTWVLPEAHQGSPPNPAPRTTSHQPEVTCTRYDDARLNRLESADPTRGAMPSRVRAAGVERVLHVHLAARGEPQTSLCSALDSLGVGERIDWLNSKSVAADILSAARRIRPTLVWMQLQTPGVLSPADIVELRAACDPRVAICTWSGDVANNNSFLRDDWAAELGRACDLVLHSSMTHVRRLRERGAPAAYLQIGYDEDRYFPGQDIDYGTSHDVVFLYHRYSHDLCRSVGDYDESQSREDIAAAVRTFPRPQCGDGVPHSASGDVYRRALFGVSVSLSSRMERYSSDRLLRCLACGVVTVVKRFDDMESWGLIHGKNCLVFDTVAEAVDLIRDWSGRPSAERFRVGSSGAKLAHDHHTWGIRMRELMYLVNIVRGS